MKKYTVVVLLFVLCASLCACGKEKIKDIIFTYNGPTYMTSGIKKNNKTGEEYMSLSAYTFKDDGTIDALILKRYSDGTVEEKIIDDGRYSFTIDEKNKKIIVSDGYGDTVFDCKIDGRVLTLISERDSSTVLTGAGNLSNEQIKKIFTTK